MKFAVSKQHVRKKKMKNEIMTAIWLEAFVICFFFFTEFKIFIDDANKKRENNNMK